MTTGPNQWPDRLFEKVDAGLRKLERHCPKCGGILHRRFSFLDKVGLYLPLPHTIYAKHVCEKCHTRFRSFRSLTDLFLEAGWLSALYFLGKYWPMALAGTLTWIIVSGGMYDTVGAGMILGIVWMLALMFGDATIGKYLESHPVVMFLLLVVLVIVPIVIVLFLERYTYFDLKEVDDDKNAKK